jgi:DNA-binding cell septation regulator SpoVG
MSVQILRLRKVDLGKTKAFFTAVIGDWEIEGLKLVEGRNGFFVGWPSRSYDSPKDGTKIWVNIVQTSNKELQNKLTEAAVAEYERREGTTAKASSVSLDDDDSEDLPF